MASAAASVCCWLANEEVACRHRRWRDVARRVAFHFDSASYGVFCGPPITRLWFERLFACIPLERRDVFIRRGDMPSWISVTLVGICREVELLFRQ